MAINYKFKKKARKLNPCIGIDSRIKRKRKTAIEKEKENNIR